MPDGSRRLAARPPVAERFSWPVANTGHHDGRLGPITGPRHASGGLTKIVQNAARDRAGRALALRGGCDANDGAFVEKTVYIGPRLDGAGQVRLACMVEGSLFMSVLTMANSTAKIGETAGHVWHALHDHGPIAVSKLVKLVDAPRDVVQQAIGWLAREDKIDIEDRGRTKVISLRPEE